MLIDVGTAAFVTGAGAGIGRAVALELAKRGATVTVVELQKAAGDEIVRLIAEEHGKLLRKPLKPSAISIQCDVAHPGYADDR